MVFVMWAIRPKGETYDITNEYERVPTMFSIKLHHDIDEFSVHELDAMMLELGYSVPPVIYYHFRIPHEDLDFGLRALGNDNDVLNLAQYIGDNKVIEVYTEHGKTNLLTCFMSPKGKQKVIIKELCDGDLPKEANVPQVPAKDKTPMIDEANDQTQLAGYMSLILFDKVPTQVSPQYRRNGRVNSIVGQSSCAKKLCLVELDDVVEDQGGDHAKLDDVVQDQGGENPKLDDVVQDQAGEHANMNDVVQDQEVEHANMDDVVQDQGGDHDNFDYDEFHYENFSHDHFDPFYGEHYQPPKDENVEDHQSEHEKSTDSDDLRQQSEEQYDELVDDENNVSEVEVDMTDFNLNLDKDYGCVQMDGFHNGVGTNDEHEDIEVIDNDRWDSLDEGLEDERKRRCVLKNLAKEKRCSLGNVYKASFYVGQKFKSKKELKEKIDMHALETRRNLYYKKNDKLRLRALCRGVVPVINASGVVGLNPKNKTKGKEVNSEKVNCSWFLHASRSNTESPWFVRTLNDNHTFLQSRKIRSCTATFISKRIMDQIDMNPGIPLRALQEQLQKDFEVGISIDKVFRAKAIATKIVEGDYTKQYEILRDYVLELQATNVDTTVKIDVYSEQNPSNPTRRFKRIYICLGPLKKGFKAGLRDLLGFNGAHMKGPFPGQVLTAVGLDSNIGIYPLAYAIVETENKSSWVRFLQCLGEDLDLGSNSNFTFIIDRQKGLIPAIAQLFPCVEHRYCLRHIHQNMRVKWKLKEYKDHLWRCATATTARSHITGRAISDILLNNLCEVFNSKIIEGRDKPIIGCLEYIRQYLMNRICNVMKVMDKAKGPLTPTATTILDVNKSHASHYITRWNGGEKYQVTRVWQDQHVVDVRNNTCTCRKWELIGIPCKHAIATLYEMTKKSEDVGDIYRWVNKVYWLDTWKNAYSYKVEPIKGRIMWPKSLCPTTLIPSIHHKQPGRPTKKRKKSEDEKLSQSQRGSQS
ncbi:unnamed protein product [Lactuca saligna]|uniref:SWIM-type domain-containing protein n=1 Tax=Lactuca saligna TaxID=75948 RepID=A0AA35ZNV5_LACSI|nr:unnamed protein product [Lactuca saligna]